MHNHTTPLIGPVGSKEGRETGLLFGRAKISRSKTISTQHLRTLPSPRIWEERDLNYFVVMRCTVGIIMSKKRKQAHGGETIPRIYLCEKKNGAEDMATHSSGTSSRQLDAGKVRNQRKSILQKNSNERSLQRGSPRSKNLHHVITKTSHRTHVDGCIWGG